MSVLFFHQQKKKFAVKVPPNISGVDGFATTNKTWAVAAFHFYVFGPYKIRSISLVAKPDINIKYYGNNSEFLSDNPIEFNLDSWLVLQRVNVRIGASDLFVGRSYMFFKEKITFNEIQEEPIIHDLLKKLNGITTISMIQPIVNLDSRDNRFTPKVEVNTGFVFIYNAT